MKKTLKVIGLTACIAVSPITADALKNSLTSILNENDTPGMVNLDGISISGKTKPQTRQNTLAQSRPPNTIISTQKGYKIRKSEADAFLKNVTKGKVDDFDRLPKKQQKLVIKELVKIHTLKNVKSRPDTAVVATVNGIAITKKEADDFLKTVSSGRVKNFDTLDNKQRKILIGDLARPIIIADIADKNLTAEEKDAALKQLWIRKQRANIDVSNEEMLALYETKKEKTLAANPNAEIPPYISIGDVLKNEIFEKKMMERLMKDANIEINYETVTPLDVNNSLNDMNQTQQKKETT